MSKADMRMTNPLTPLEREQLRYIVERVPEWPEGANILWASAVGHVRKDDEFDCVFEPDTGVEWEYYSPDFTRSEYEAMKAEIEVEKADVPCCFPACGCPMRIRSDTASGLFCQRGRKIVDAEEVKPDYREVARELATKLGALCQSLDWLSHDYNFVLPDTYDDAVTALAKYNAMEEGKNG